MLVTGQAGIPWEAGHFWDGSSAIRCCVHDRAAGQVRAADRLLLQPRGRSCSRFYFLCVMLWTVATWSLFGGAITRIAAVQVARGEKIGLCEAVRFTVKRLLSYITAPLFPLLFVFVLLVVMVICSASLHDPRSSATSSWPACSGR